MSAAITISSSEVISLFSKSLERETSRLAPLLKRRIERWAVLDDEIMQKRIANKKASEESDRRDYHARVRIIVRKIIKDIRRMPMAYDVRGITGIRELARNSTHFRDSTLLPFSLGTRRVDIFDDELRMILEDIDSRTRGVSLSALRSVVDAAKASMAHDSTITIETKQFNEFTDFVKREVEMHEKDSNA